MSLQEYCWYDIHAPLVFGRGWKDTEPEFGRLPAKAEKLVPEKVWNMRRNSSGMYVEFCTNSCSLAVRWELADEVFGEMNFNVCAFSGVDLLCFSNGKWRFTAAPNAVSQQNEVELWTELEKKERLFRLYFPFRNCVKNIAVRVDKECFFKWEKPVDQPQIIYYGSSIIHGSCGSRAGNGITSLLGRALDRPVVNLGFSGSAKLEPGIAELLTETNALFYIIDPFPNCDTALVKERLEPFLRHLCSACGTKPVFLLTDADRRGAWMHPDAVLAHRRKRAAAKRIVKQLQQGFPHLHLIDMVRSMGNDSEGTVDGIHPDELGVSRFSTYLIRQLRKHL